MYVNLLQVTIDNFMQENGFVISLHNSWKMRKIWNNGVIWSILKKILYLVYLL